MKIQGNARQAHDLLNILPSSQDALFSPSFQGKSNMENALQESETAEGIGAVRARLAEFLPNIPLLSGPFVKRDIPAIPPEKTELFARMDTLIEQHPECLTPQETDALKRFMLGGDFAPYLARLEGGYALRSLDFSQSVEMFANKAARILFNLRMYCKDSEAERNIARSVEKAGYLLSELLAQCIAQYMESQEIDFDSADFTESMQSIIMQRQFAYQLDYAGGRITNRDRFCDVYAMMADSQYGDMPAREEISAKSAKFGWITYGDIIIFTQILRELEEVLPMARAQLYAKREAGLVKNPAMRRLRYMRLLDGRSVPVPDMLFAQSLGLIYGECLHAAEMVAESNPYRETVYRAAYARILLHFYEDREILRAECREMNFRPYLEKYFAEISAQAAEEIIAGRCRRYRMESA